MKCPNRVKTKKHLRRLSEILAIVKGDIKFYAAKYSETRDTDHYVIMKDCYRKYDLVLEGYHYYLHVRQLEKQQVRDYGRLGRR